MNRHGSLHDHNDPRLPDTTRSMKGTAMSEEKGTGGFGLIIIGSEILDGRVRDSHLVNMQRLLAERHHSLAYTMTLIDDPRLITEQLRWALSRPEPFFCCGGIGATPDDYTRQCAADATGLTLAYHPEGVTIMEGRFGTEVTPHRLRLVEFPAGATLIPNPVNQVPGFSIGTGHFLPGFPSMAEPMMAWVLDTRYKEGTEIITGTLVLPGVRESDIIPLMDAFNRRHLPIRLSSLPRFVEGGTEIRLGLTGSPEDVQTGLADIIQSIESAGMPWRKA